MILWLLTLTFRSLKRNIIDPEPGANKALPLQQLRAKVLSLRSNDGLIFSVVCRLLANNIRQKLLVNIHSRDDLLNGPYLAITVSILHVLQHRLSVFLLCKLTLLSTHRV